MTIDVTRPIRRPNGTPDRLGTVVTRSPLEDVKPYEQREQTVADGRGLAYFVYRDDIGHHRLSPLDQDPMVLGRDQGANIVLDWDRTVSRQHATLRWTPEGWVLEDAGRSMNGTLVNGEVIHGEHVLQDRDLVQVGETALAYRNPRQATG